MLWIVLVIVVIALGVLLVMKQQGRGAGAGAAYLKQPALFTPAERSFLGVLDLAVGKDFRVFGKVRVGDVLAPKSGMNRGGRQTALNRVNLKHFDFLLCRPSDLAVLCAIELNDASHRKQNRQERDAFLAEACRGAALPLAQFEARRSYSPVEISARIAETMAGQVTERVEPVLSAAVREAGVVPIAENEIAPLCPRCSGTMVRRIAQAGDNAGKEFWGCSNFPKCREIVTS